MIRILFFIEALKAGGAEKVLLNLVGAMDPDRFAVTVATPWPEDRRLLPSQVSYRSLYPAKNTLTRNLYRLEAQLGTAVRRIRGQFDIEVAYLECGPTKLLSSSKSGAKKVAWVHCDLAKKQADIDAFVRTSAPWYRRFDHVVCVSENVRESFCRLYPDAPPSSVLYNINDEQEILRNANAFSPDASPVPTLCAIGRLAHQKGFDRLIRACARMKELPFRLQILGEGPERQALEVLIEENGLRDRVELLGYRSNPYPYMKHADLIVCSSRYEGFSTVVTEALILGRPVVTTPCAGMAELLGNNEFGVITDDLYDSLKRMLTDPELRAHYAAAAARRGRDFRKEELVRRTEAFFTELLEGTRSE